MDLQQQIGQLLMAGFQGDSLQPDSPIVADIKQRNLGGVILFDRLLATKSATNNIRSPEQTQKLISSLQDAAHGRLLVAVDQEGGQVSRFKKEQGFATTPAAAVLGQNPDTSATTLAAGQTAAMLADLGVNFNLAPVVDLNRHPDNPIIGRYQRSFADDPKTVTSHALAWIKAHRKRNIRCCLKHFPGHGSSRTDSHLGFVDVSATWERSELVPYRELINGGMVDAVMTGHLFNSALDSSYPATLSARTVTTMLREELGFSGAVVSDDLQMGAITDRYEVGEAAWRALAAGVDILILGNNLAYNPQIVAMVISAISQAVSRGLLTELCIHQAWQRVQQLKQPLPTTNT